MEIYIAKPCSEKLENMLISTEGYFCLNCQKKVIDFTQKTDTEIQKYMEEAENPVCGFANELLADFQPGIATPCSARRWQTESRTLKNSSRVEVIK